jgi:hypothetical protein
MLEYMIIMIVVMGIVGPIAIWSSWNEINANEWIALNVEGCPFKYKWQIADDLSASRKDIKFSHLMVLPKAEVKKLWLLAKEGN